MLLELFIFKNFDDEYDKYCAMSGPSSIPNFAALVTAFCDFLTVAIHSILFERKLYPPESFIAARKYNYVVRQSRHPKVCQWITDVVAAVETELLKGTIARVALVIFSLKHQPLERFLFDLSKFPWVPKEDRLTTFERDISIVDIDEQFRAVMAKLRVSCLNLKPLPESSTFTLAIELKDSADPPIGHPQPWIPTEPALQKQVVNRDGELAETRKGDDLGGAQTTPIRAVDAGDLAFEMWIEESRAKVDAESTNDGSWSNPFA